jgi:hypothetical protein
MFVENDGHRSMLWEMNLIFLFHMVVVPFMYLIFYVPN